MANFTSNAAMNFDRFPTNVCETSGYIERKPITFVFSRVEVWFNGKCIFNLDKQAHLIGDLVNKNMYFKVDNSNLEKYISKEFTFEEISTTSNRIVWSKDLTNQKNLSYPDLVPYLVSLFYMNSELVKVAFNIANQNTLIELYK